VIQVANRDEVLKRYAEFTGQLSTQCRTLGVGILAFAWALMTSNDSPLKDAATHSLGRAASRNLIGISLLVILVLAADAVQYYVGMRVEEGVLEKMEKNHCDTAMYGRDTRAVQGVAFHAKLVGLAIAVLWLVIFLGCALL
jgi:hypothetical protein